MTTDDFKKNYDRAPFSLEDFASAASCVTDNTELSTAALKYLKAKAIFELELEINDVEVG